SLERGFDVARVEQGADGFTLHGRDDRILRGDCLLWAIGREPATRGMGLEAAGVALDAEGHVVVDAWQNTSVAGVYALGDVIGGNRTLTPVAIAAGRRLADRPFGGEADAR